MTRGSVRQILGIAVVVLALIASIVDGPFLIAAIALAGIALMLEGRSPW